ncbi:MAG TPA: tRNA-(ms[2]io[6]A)-hydroxylase [Saprospiraceae bacterium]|nr:tRNA-(ms[2]io[6]A)-hydroxylase [Saprospiraceae bacterium]
MKLSLDIAEASPPGWIKAVMDDFDAFLRDHADCERKASAMALSMVAKYPDRTAILPDLIDTALEELEHFKLVYQIMEMRGVQLPASMPEDPYIRALMALMKTPVLPRFLDRLLVASLVEMRGAERFRLVEEALEDPELKRFYKMLWTSEAKHGNIYVKMALQYFDEKEVYDRLRWWIEQEGRIIASLPLRAALH